MAIVTIVGSGMMGSALAFPARENGHEVRLVGTHLDRDIIEYCRAEGRHPKFSKDFPSGVKYYQIEELDSALDGADVVIGGVSSFGVDWFGEYVLPRVKEKVPVHHRHQRTYGHCRRKTSLLSAGVGGKGCVPWGAI